MLSRPEVTLGFDVSISALEISKTRIRRRSTHLPDNTHPRHTCLTSRIWIVVGSRSVLRRIDELQVAYSSIPQRNEGLAASTLAARRPSLGALREVFSRWPHVTSAIESMALTETTSPQDLLRHEQELARFYVQTFWEYAGRAAAVPRRLPGVL